MVRTVHFLLQTEWKKEEEGISGQSSGDLRSRI